MYSAGWISSPLESNPKQIWHTESYNGGSNYVGFGNAQSDKIIENLVVTIDRNKRAEYYKQLEQMINDECPYAFILAPKNRMAVSKRFSDNYTTGIRPGYWEGSFILKNKS